MPLAIQFLGRRGSVERMLEEVRKHYRERSLSLTHQTQQSEDPPLPTGVGDVGV